MSRSFRLFAQLGFDTSIILGHQLNGKISEETFSHIDYDGINGFVAALEERKAFEPEGFPPIPERPQRGFLARWLNRFRQYFRCLGQFSHQSRRWIYAAAPAAGPLTVWRFLDRGETDKARAQARQGAISLNTHLLYHLDRCVEPRLEASAQPRAWIIPVLLYQNWREALIPGNRTSIMEINIADGDSAEAIQRQIRDEIGREAYWGPWLATLINAWLPDPLNRAILKSTVAKKLRVGTFTNLGRWKGRESAPDEGWVALPPVHAGQPLGAGVLEFNGRLGLAFKIDASLGLNRAGAQSLMDDWAARLNRPARRDS